MVVFFANLYVRKPDEGTTGSESTALISQTIGIAKHVYLNPGDSLLFRQACGRIWPFLVKDVEDLVSGTFFNSSNLPIASIQRRWQILSLRPGCLRPTRSE